MTTLQGAAPPVLLGEQQPRLSLVPSYVSSAGDEAIELAAMAGLYLDPWQQLVLRHSLGERQDGKWAAFEVGLCVPRQNGKNALLEARELAELFLVAHDSGPRTIIHSAHLFPTSLEHFRRLAQRIRDTPELARKVKRRGSKLVGIRESHGEESIELVDGSRILFAARTKGGRRGFTVDLLVWDEAMDLPDSVVGSVMPTVSARTGDEYLPGPQIWYTGSAVNESNTDYGHQFTRVRERGVTAADSSLAYFEWSADDDDDPASPEAWAKANPGLEIRITADYVAREYAGMPLSEFLVERLGVSPWVDLSAAAGRVISIEAWAACAERDPSNRIVSGQTFAVDTNTDQTFASVGVAGIRADGLPQIAVVEHAAGVDWVTPACVELARQHADARFAVEKLGPAANLMPELTAAGLVVLEASSQDYGTACADLTKAAAAGRLRHPFPQPQLDQALAGARKQALGERWKWSRKQSTAVDISPLVACTLALWGSTVPHAAEPSNDWYLL